jgi:hypothetical protein
MSDFLDDAGGLGIVGGGPDVRGRPSPERPIHRAGAQVEWVGARLEQGVRRRSANGRCRKGDNAVASTR